MEPKDTAQSSPVTSRHVAKGVGTTLLSRLGAVIELVSQPLYVAMFGLASFGIYTVLWAAVNLFENVFDLGMTSAMQRTVPQAKDDRDAVASLRAAMILGLGPCTLVAALCVIFAPQIAPMLNVAVSDRHLLIPSIRLFAWALPLWAFVEIATSALRARHLFGAEIRLRIVWEQVIRLVLAAILYFAGLGLTGLFIAHMTSLFITVLLSIRLLNRHYVLKHFLEGPVFGTMFSDTAKAGLSVLPANMVGRLFGDAPAIVLNMLIPGAAGASAAALYTIGRKISSVVQLVRVAFVYVLAPLASSALRHDMNHVRPIYAYATRLITAVVTPLTLVLSAATIPMLAVFGHGANAAQGAVVLLILARGVEAILGPSVPILQVVSGYGRQIIASVVGLACACGVAAIAIPLSPLTGMAGAVGLGFIISSAIPMAQLQIHDGLHPFDGGFRRVLVRAVGISLVAIAIALPATMLHEAIALPVCVIVELAAMWCSCRFALQEPDRESLGKTARKLRLI